MSAPDRPALTPLAARAQLGDRPALEALLRQLADRLRSHVEQLAGDRDVADDVLQDVLLCIARKLPSLRDPRWVRAWAYRIATRMALRQVGHARRNMLTSIDSLAELPSPDPRDDAPFDADVLARLPAVVSALPEGSQIVIRLHYMHGLTQPEVAEVLSIPLGTVKSRIAYGLRQLRVHLPRGDAGRG